MVSPQILNEALQGQFLAGWWNLVNWHISVIFAQPCQICTNDSPGESEVPWIVDGSGDPLSISAHPVASSNTKPNAKMSAATPALRGTCQPCQRQRWLSPNMSKYYQILSNTGITVGGCRWKVPETYSKGVFVMTIWHEISSSGDSSFAPADNGLVTTSWY